MMVRDPLRLGVIGLGRAFTIMVPTFVNDPRIQLVGATDPLPAARARFEADFGACAYETADALCAASEVEAIYVATPHHLHADHVCLAAAAGKHVLVEKPMSIAIEDCTRMIKAARSAGVVLVVGPSHSFDRPVQRIRSMIDRGRWGQVRMISAFNYTDFLYRPRRPKELLSSSEGGGAIHNQGAHQVDILRLLAGGRVTSVSAHAGAWDRERPTEGAYCAMLQFESGIFGAVVYNGYGHYDSDVLMNNIGETGFLKSAGEYGAARRALRNIDPWQREEDYKSQGSFGGVHWNPRDESGRVGYEHFGHIVVSCDRADLRPTPLGVEIYGDDKVETESMERPAVPRSEVIDEFYSAVRNGTTPLHSGEWGRATTEVCVAIVQSARTGKPYWDFKFQVSPAGHDFQVPLSSRQSNA